MDSNNVIEFPKMHEDTLADALGLEPEEYKYNQDGKQVSVTITTSSTGSANVMVNAAPPCPNCGQPYFSHPRMGISHVCRTDVVNALPNDTQYSRENIYDVVERTSEAINKMNRLIDENPSARNFEVLNQLLNTQAENAERLLALQERKVKLAQATGYSVNPKNVNIANAVFVGTNSELLDMLKGKSHKIIEHEDMRED